MDNQENKVFFAAESSSFIERTFLGPDRGFTITVLDNSGQKIADFSRGTQEWLLSILFVLKNPGKILDLCDFAAKFLPSGQNHWIS